MWHNVVAPDQVSILQDSDLPHQASLPVPDFGDILYTYRKQATLDGVPVLQQAQNLMVSSQDQLRSALQLRSTVHVFLAWLMPTAEQQLAQYQNIVQAAAEGSVRILQQTKQYSQAKGAFLVFVKYQSVQYTLHPRWQHLKDSNEVYHER